jgi:hypothetical protein
VGLLEISNIAVMNEEWHSHFGEVVWPFLTNLNIHLLYDSAILLIEEEKKINTDEHRLGSKCLL